MDGKETVRLTKPLSWSGGRRRHTKCEVERAAEEVSHEMWKFEALMSALIPKMSFSVCVGAPMHVTDQ